MAILIEPFFYCLLASLIWAPLVFLAASFIAGSDKNARRAGPLSGKIWPAALMIAALPVLLAPVAAALGLSLRAPEPLPPMVDAIGPAAVVTQAPVIATYDAPRTVSLADILRMTAVLYFYGFMMLFVLAAVRHIWFAYRLNYAFTLDEPRLEAELEAWRARIGVTRRPRYVFSHIISSVCVYGFFRPVIIMPMNLLDRVSIEDAALMGAHEMAHIKRHDVALFALGSVAKAVFWFNPFMHHICARANLTAEQGADALVLARGVNRRQYAHCFVQGLRLAADTRYGFAGEFIPSFTPFDKRSRRQRLDAILSGAPEGASLSLTSKIGLASGAVVAAGLAFAQAAFAVSPPAIEDALTVRPVEGEVTFGYGEKSKLLGDDRPSHEGIDLRAAKGAPVRASGDGKVIAATDNYHGQKSWGNVVVIDHGHGLITRYAHLDSYAVEKGEHVDAGEIIGAVGATGVASGPHLHFEVISEGETVDPAPVAAPTPLAAPSPKPRTTMKRSVQVSPAPAALAAAPPVKSAPSKPSAPAATESGRTHERKLESKLHTLEERLREQFDTFDAFRELEGKSIHFNNVDLEGFKGAQEFADLVDGNEFAFSDLGDMIPDMTEFVANMRMDQEQLQALRESRQDAMQDAMEAMADAKERLQDEKEARAEALRDMREEARDREREEKERQRELKQERKRHAQEMDRMRREAEQELTRADHEWANEYDGMISEREILEQREQALRNAKQNLELQLAEIERRRKELSDSE